MMMQGILIGSDSASLVLALFFLCKLLVSLRRFRMKETTSPMRRLAELPSVSVCIPARNETHAMTACLERTIASTYPKLEIIVLDDSSVDDTSILIKSFAHAGVRFVEGSALPEGWLGKNHAFEMLRREASGTYILYMDVDTQIQPETIGQLVSVMEQEHVDMLSILPQRMDNWRLNVIFSGLRYFWSLILSTRRSPAVASNAWMIRKQVLDTELGGLSPYRLDVQPEKRLASRLSARGAYTFLLSNPTLGVAYEKLYSSFVETNIRLLYPMAGGRAWRGLLACLTLLVQLWPLGTVASAWVFGWHVYQLLALMELILFGLIYALYLSKVWYRGWWLGVLLWPVVLVQDTILFVISVVKYARGTVTWKGRPVVAPKLARTTSR